MKLSAEGVTKKKNDTLEFLPSEQEVSLESHSILLKKCFIIKVVLYYL